MAKFERGRKKTGGRKIGVPNKVPNAAKKHALLFGLQMMEILIEIAHDKTMPPNARVHAIALILDRALGKATAMVPKPPESQLKFLTTAELLQISEQLGIPILR